MLANLTSKNQITLPKAVMSSFSDVSYFDVREESGRIVLEPLRVSRVDEVRARLAGVFEVRLSRARSAVPEGLDHCAGRGPAPG